MSEDEKIEGKYEYIKPNALIYVINEIQEDSIVEALIDDRNDQPYIRGTVLKVNKQTQEVEIYITELQKNMTVKFEFTLPMPNIQLLKKIENLTDYYPDLNYMDIFNVFKMRFQSKKYFTQVGQDLLVNLDPYHNTYNIYSGNEINILRNKEEIEGFSKKQLKKVIKDGNQKMINEEDLNNSKNVEQNNKNLINTQRSSHSYNADKYFDEFFENNENEIYIFRGEMYSNKYILFEKLLSKLLPEENVSNIQADDNEIMNTENNDQSQDNNLNINNNTNKMNQSQEAFNIDSKIYLCYQIFKFFGCIVETTESAMNKDGSMDEENNFNASANKEEDSVRINYKYLMRINIQYNKKKKILGGEFLPILFCDPNLNYILTHVIFYSLFNITRTEKLYHELYLQNLHHVKEHSRKGKKNNFIYTDEIKELIKKEFNINILIKYFSLLNFNEEEIKTILNICVSIMFLSEISFKNNMSSGNVVVENDDIIHILSDLLKIKEESIKMALLVNTRDINGESNPKFYKAKECEINKNLIGMVLYTSLYYWLSNKFNLIIKYEVENNKNNSKNNNKPSEKQRSSMSSLDLYNKYRDENEIKDEEKEEEKDDDENEDSKNEPQIIKTKTNNIKEKNNLNNSNIEEEKSKDDLMEDVYDMKNKKVIVESIPHNTSVLISPGFKFQFNEKLGLSTFLCNYINEKIFCLFSTTIYKRKLNEMKEEGLEEYANNIPFSDNMNLIELYEHESFNLLNTINNFCNDFPPNNLNNEIIPLYTNLNTKFALNEQIKFGSRENKDFLIYQTEGQAKYDLTQLIYENYNDISFEVYKTLLSSSNNTLCLIILGILKEEEILNKKDNLFDEFVMSNGLPRKRTFIINLVRTKLIKIFENIDNFENVQNEEKKKNLINRYKFFLCLKCNNDFYKDVIYPRYLFNQLVYNDLLDVINFYKEQFEKEITYENFVHKIFRKVDLEGSSKKFNKNSNDNNTVNSINKISDDKQRTIKIIDILINFKVSKWYQNFEEIDLNPNNYVLGNTKIFLQKSFYNYLLYKMQAFIENKRRSISKIIGHFRGFFFRIKYNNYIRGIIGVQQYYWKYKEKLRKQMYRKKVILLQSVFRANKQRKIIKKIRNSQIFISKNFRKYSKLKYYKQVKKSVNILIPCIKKFLSFLIIKEHKDLKDFVYKIVRNAFDRIILREKIEKSIIINAFFRRILFQINHPKLMAQIKKSIDMRKMIKSSLVIQRYYRTYKAFKEFNYKKYAVDLIRGYWKMKRSVQYIDDLYNSIVPIQRGVRKYLNVKRSYTIVMKNYMDQKYNNYSSSEIKKILHYFRIIQREYLQKEGYIKKNKAGIPKVVNINDDKIINKSNTKSFVQKILFFTEINDIDLYNSTILVYNNEFWCDKFYKLLKVDKKIFGNNSSFLNIKIGEAYSCLLNSKGKIYTFGWNEFGQCNIDTVSSEQKHISSLVFSQIECCNKYSYLMNNKGEISQNFNKYNDIIFDGYVSDHSDSIYAWKDNYYYKFKDSKVNKYKININIKKNSIIKKIACGKNFVIFLSDTGLIYSYGKNTKGQLGLEDYKERNTPTLNELLVRDGERIIDVACGFKHTIALGVNGKVFSWGSNSNGQCGIDIGGNFNTPMYIDVKNKIKFISICCGFRASFFMDEQRILYFCGKSGINNGENYFLQYFKNLIGKEETMNLMNNLNHLHDNKNLEIHNNSINTIKENKKKKNKRSSSTINFNKNSNVRMVSCLNKNIYPVKLNCSWNECFSVMYVTYADTTNLINNAYKKELNKKTVKYILDKITLNWTTDNINVRNVMKNYKDILEYL